MTDLPITARSFVNAWQCDENDHLNVQFYTGWADEASPHLHALLGAGSEQAIVPVQDYIRYHREMLTADAVEVRSAPTAIDDDTLVAYHEIRNGNTGDIAATVRRVTQRFAANGATQSWSAEFAQRARQAAIALPELARPRTVGSRGEIPELAMDDPRCASLFEIGRGQVSASECSFVGTMSPRAVFGRFSDGAGFLWQALGFTRQIMRQRAQGTAVIEMLCNYHELPNDGTLIVLRSGLIAASDRVLHIVHFLFDATDGRLLVQAEGVGVLFDLEARKIARLSHEEQRHLEGLRLRL